MMPFAMTGRLKKKEAEEKRRKGIRAGSQKREGNANPLDGHENNTTHLIFVGYLFIERC